MNDMCVRCGTEGIELLPNFTVGPHNIPEGYPCRIGDMNKIDYENEQLQKHRKEPFTISPTYLNTQEPLSKREEIAKSNLNALIIKHGIFDETYNRKWLVEKSIERADLLMRELPRKGFKYV